MAATQDTHHIPHTMEQKTDMGSKWRRTGKPRSKRGCHTCKRRRLKCGEEKPACRRCVKSNNICEGYPIPKGEKAPAAVISTSRQILPKAPKDGLSGVQPSGLLATRTEVESTYIKHFLSQATSGREGMMEWSVWNNLILQFSTREPFVHDSCVAIGALMKGIELDQVTHADATSTPDPTSLKMAKMHREYALLKYGQAVKTMQAALVGAELRQVLIACLLVYCFENLLSNRHLALSHIVSGHALLRKWLVNQNQIIPNNRNIHSPASHVIDDELVEAFGHIDLQIATVYDARPLEMHRASVREGDNVIERMPPCFSDLLEAKGYLLVVMRRCYHFLATTWPSSEASTLFRDLELLPPEDVVVTTGVNIYSTSYTVSDTLREEQKYFAQDISRWSKAFQPLFLAARRSELVGSRNHLVATLLRIHELATTISIAGVVFTDECSYDTYLATFQEIFSLVTIVVGHHRNKAFKDGASFFSGFFLDLGIAAPLYLLTTRCRDHTLRANAIEILRGWHGEGLWQPKLIAAIGDFVMDVEEEGNGEHFIPEKSRAVFTAVCDEPQRTPNKHEAVLQCVQRYGSPNGGPVWHERRVFY